MSLVQNVQWTRHIITVHLCQKRGQEHPVFLEQLYLIPVTFGGYTTIHFVLATLCQPIYRKLMKKMHLFSESFGAQQSTTQKVTS